jgi:hypothetical protein
MLKYFLISFTIALIIFLGLGLIAKDNKKAYESCISAGIQSNDTCYFYAYQ